MKNIFAKDIMTKNPVTVTGDMAVKDLAELLAAKNIGGAPVVDDAGRVIGIVSESDLVVRDARIHYPTYIHLLDGFIYWPASVAKFNDEFKKALGSTVGDIMSDEVATAGPGATLEDLATLVVDNAIDRLPIVDADGKPIGIVTKHDIVTAISRNS